MADVGRRGKTGRTGKTGAAGRSGLRTNLAFYVFVVAWLVGTGAYEYYDEKGDKATVEAQIIQNCQEIEEIKEGGRMAAWRDFNNLNNTLRILRIPKTRDVVVAAKYSRDRRLAQYARKPCPREDK